MENKTWIWRETAEVLGVLGVLGTLIFVAFEIRQNTEAMRSVSVQAIAQMSFEATTLPVQNADLRAALRAAAGQSLTEDQRQQLTVYYAALMRVQLNRFYQAQLGILDQETVLQIGGQGGAYRGPFFLQFWNQNKGDYPMEFQEFVYQELLPLSSGSP